MLKLMPNQKESTLLLYQNIKLASQKSALNSNNYY